MRIRIPTPSLDFLLGHGRFQPSRMPATDERWSRGWIIGFKILLFIPVAVTAFMQKELYEFAKTHPQILQSPPYHPLIELSLLFAYIGLMTLFPWVFISAALTYYARGFWILIIGILDLGLALLIAIAAGMQGQYLPATMKGCNGDKPVKWQITGDEDSFFVLVANLDTPGKDASPQKACKSFVAAWEMMVACLFFQWLVAYIGVFFDARPRSLLNPWRPLFNMILIFLAPFIFMQHSIFPRLRLAYRYTIKNIQCLGGQKPPTFTKPAPYTPAYQHKISNPQLQRIINIEHVLLNIVDHMCYEDVINLSLASKSTREAIFPGRDLEYRIPKLRAHCCTSALKKKCEYCNKHLCPGCWKQQILDGMAGPRHLYCTPYCRECYYTAFSKHTRGYKRPCHCNSTDRVSQLQDICRSCNALHPTKMQEKRHKRYVQEVRDLAFSNKEAMHRCGKCKKSLKAGVRWWVCARCKGECRDSIHPAYVGKRKTNEEDVEKGDTAGEEGRASKWWRILRGRG